MKIIILTAIKEWLCTKIKFGFNLWKEIASQMEIDADKFTKKDNYLSVEDFNRLFQMIFKKTGLEGQEIIKQFLEYWNSEFKQKLIVFLKQKAINIKEFISSLIKINSEIRDIFPENQAVWIINMKEIDNNTMELHYTLDNQMVEFIKIINEVNFQYKNKLTMNKLNSFTIQISF